MSNSTILPNTGVVVAASATSSPIKIKEYRRVALADESTSGAFLLALTPVVRAAAIASAQIALAKFAVSLKNYITGPSGEALAASLLASRSAGFKLKFTDLLAHMEKDELLAGEFQSLLLKLQRINAKANAVHAKE